MAKTTLTGVFAQQWQGSTNPRTGSWEPELDRNGKRIPSASVTCTMENGAKGDLPTVLTAKRIAKLSELRPDLSLDSSRDYVLTKTKQFDDRDGRTPAIRGWYRPKAEPISI